MESQTLNSKWNISKSNKIGLKIQSLEKGNTWSRRKQQNFTGYFVLRLQLRTRFQKLKWNDTQ